MKRWRCVLADFSGVFAMSHLNHDNSPRYIAYIDEAGDDGLNTVRPIDKNGGCEWLIIGAMIVRSCRAHEADEWLSVIMNDLDHYKLPTLHFKNCNVRNGRIVTEHIGNLPVRCFAVASNKKNMRRYHNPLPAMISSKNWFYCWLTRLMLERLTYFAYHMSIQEFGRPYPLQIELSERGRFSYAQLDAYYAWLRMKNTSGRNKLPLGDLSWQVIDRNFIEIHPNENRAGLQLADAVASSFLRACDVFSVSRKQQDLDAALNLSSRMATDPARPDLPRHGFSVKLMPGFGKAQLLPQQQKIFRHFGYPKPQWWMPEK